MSPLCRARHYDIVYRVSTLARRDRGCGRPDPLQCYSSTDIWQQHGHGSEPGPASSLGGRLLPFQSSRFRIRASPLSHVSSGTAVVRGSMAPPQCTPSVHLYTQSPVATPRARRTPGAWGELRTLCAPHTCSSKLIDHFHPRLCSAPLCSAQLCSRGRRHGGGRSASLARCWAGSVTGSLVATTLRRAPRPAS